MEEMKSLSEEVRKNIIEPIIKIDSNGNKYVREEDLASLNLDTNETLFVRRLLSSDEIDFRKEGTITEEDRPKKVSEYNYGEVAGNDMEHLDRPKIATIEYKGEQLVFEDYEELDKFIEEVFLPEAVQMKTVHSSDGNPYPSVQFNKIVKLGLSEKELKHVLDYLDASDIRVGGKSQDLEGEAKNYDYVHNYHHLELPESKSSEEVLQMFFEYREMKDDTPEKEKMRNDIIECNMRLVPYVAYRLAYFYGVDLQELESYGYEALIKAVDKFDPSFGFMFSTYAVECLKGEMMRAAGEMNEMPQYYFFEFNRAKKAVEESMGKKFNPNDSEMLDEILDFLIERGRITEGNREIIRSRISSNTSSYISFENFTDTWDLTVNPTHSRPTEIKAIGSELSASLRDVLETLTPREQKVLELRFGILDGKTRNLEEVGKVFNVTRERVRQIESKALRKLRHPYRSRKLRGYLDGEIVSDIPAVTNSPNLGPITSVKKDVDTSKAVSGKSR